jgi:hypothetical protein
MVRWSAVESGRGLEWVLRWKSWTGWREMTVRFRFSTRLAGIVSASTMEGSLLIGCPTFASSTSQLAPRVDVDSIAAVSQDIRDPSSCQSRLRDNRCFRRPRLTHIRLHIESKFHASERFP